MSQEVSPPRASFDHMSVSMLELWLTNLHWVLRFSISTQSQSDLFLPTR
jgi:hypothetical protein